MAHVRIDMHLYCFPKSFQPLLQIANRLRRCRLIALRVNSSHWRLEIRKIWSHVGMDAVEHHASADFFILTRCVERKGASHTKTDGSQFVSGGCVQREEIFNGAPKILFSLINSERHH